MEHEGIPQRSHKEYSEAPNQLPQAGEVRADKRKRRSVRGSGGNMSERARELRELTGCHGMSRYVTVPPSYGQALEGRLDNSRRGKGPRESTKNGIWQVWKRRRGWRASDDITTKAVVQGSDIRAEAERNGYLT